MYTVALQVLILKMIVVYYEDIIITCKIPGDGHPSWKIFLANPLPFLNFFETGDNKIGIIYNYVNLR